MTEVSEKCGTDTFDGKGVVKDQKSRDLSQAEKPWHDCQPPAMGTHIPKKHSQKDSHQYHSGQTHTKSVECML